MLELKWKHGSGAVFKHIKEYVNSLACPGKSWKKENRLSPKSCKKIRSSKEQSFKNEQVRCTKDKMKFKKNWKQKQLKKNTFTDCVVIKVAVIRRRIKDKMPSADAQSFSLTSQTHTSDFLKAPEKQQTSAEPVTVSQGKLWGCGEGGPESWTL